MAWKQRHRSIGIESYGTTVIPRLTIRICIFYVIPDRDISAIKKNMINIFSCIGWLILFFNLKKKWAKFVFEKKKPTNNFLNTKSVSKVI